MWLDFQREWAIRKVLRKLSKQRVALVLQPGNVWVVEKALKNTEENEAILNTCLIRGWVEPLQDSVPKGKLNEDGSLPENLYDSAGTVWKLTDSGWASINRAHHWVLISFIISALGLFHAIYKTDFLGTEDLNCQRTTIIQSNSSK